MVKLKKSKAIKYVPLIIILNSIVFACWTYAIFMAENTTFFEQNFLVSWQGLLDGRYWVLITSVFSHNMFLHFFINMFVLKSFGSVMERVLGSQRFIKFYLVAGIVGSLAHAFTSGIWMGDPDLKALGASGAIVGVVLLFSLMFPKEKILIFGIIPMPAIFGALLFIGLDIWGLIEQTQGGGLPIGHGAHLGGALTGILYYFFILKKRNY